MNEKEINKELKNKIFKYLGILLLLGLIATSLYLAFGYVSADENLMTNVKMIGGAIGVPSTFFILNSIKSVVSHKKTKEVWDAIGMNKEKVDDIEKINKDKTINPVEKARKINEIIGR